VSYCTLADLLTTYKDSQREFIQLTDTDNLGVINTEVLNQAIARADAEINSYLLAYLPLTEVPANLVYLACDITRYYLYMDQMIDRVETLYKAAVSYLNLVATNKIPLTLSVVGIPVQTSLASVAYIAVDADQFGKDAY